jgi:hypothetical protein
MIKGLESVVLPMIRANAIRMGAASTNRRSASRLLRALSFPVHRQVLDIGQR